MPLGASLRRTSALAACALLALAAGCPEDAAAPAADADVADTAVADTVAPPDTADLADAEVAPDTLAPADTLEPVDTLEPADTLELADAIPPADTSAPGTFPLTCAVHADCNVACASGRCEGDHCVFLAPQPGCVVADATGATGACVVAGAVSPEAACLACNPAVQAAGYTGVVWHNDFDGGASGMTIEKLAESAATWSLNSRRAATGTTSLYFGHPSQPSYAVDARAAGRATSPPLEGPAGAPLSLSFDLWLDTEETAGFDYLRVLVDDGVGQPVEVWHSDAFGGTTYGEFLPVAVDLGALTTPGMRVVFEFDSVDEIINDYEGAYVDAVHVATGCCAGAADCDDGDACTDDRCGDDGRCAFDVRDGCCLLARDCDDGDACTEDVCAEAGGDCAFAPIFDCCHALADCNDDDPCTEDLCSGDGALCQHQPLCCAADADCDDGDPCTRGSCEGGACSYVFACCEGAADCDDGDACTADTCVGTTCRHEFTPVPGCCRPDVLTERFDAGVPTGWTLSAATANVGWRVLATAQAQSGTSVLYYGHPTLHYYDSGGAPNKGTATSANLRLPDGVEVRLTLKVRLDVEASLFKDVFKVDALVGAAVVALVTKSDLQGAGWHAVSVDVSGLAGQNVRLRFSFDTLDGLANATEGVMIDDLRVLSSCHPRPCQLDVSCPSPAPCITGRCEAGGCSYGGGC